MKTFKAVSVGLSLSWSNTIFSKQNVIISLREEHRDCQEIDTTLIFYISSWR